MGIPGVTGGPLPLVPPVPGTPRVGAQGRSWGETPQLTQGSGWRGQGQYEGLSGDPWGSWEWLSEETLSSEWGSPWWWAHKPPDPQALGTPKLGVQGSSGEGSLT